MKPEEEMEGFCASGTQISSGRQWGVYSLILVLFWITPPLVFSAVGAENTAQSAALPVKAGIDMPAPIQTIRLHRVKTAPSETAPAPEPPAESAAERETETADVSPDTQLDAQIKEEIAATHETNLLTEE